MEMWGEKVKEAGLVDYIDGNVGEKVKEAGLLDYIDGKVGKKAKEAKEAGLVDYMKLTRVEGKEQSTHTRDEADKVTKEK
ncbi:hypothetical protein [Paenibacillus albus]|uniref:Uncharacterized protein n=1 Tax=Paenibacillus albus TaxID=2495582 RepID=A0A3Q8X328_9BACL|nr:hypothetical protein [Paenibacillus albus]AZN39339.1 hypothetical protein EJC50_06440 [Paenibacillus albus]